MPLKPSTELPGTIATWLKTTATPSKPAFLVVYASLTNGRSWCGDCRQAEPFVEKKFGGMEEEVGVVYVGMIGEWRRWDNPWKKEPFSITNLPTLVKVTSDGKFHKLVEGDVYNQKKLDAFVGA